MTGVETLVLWYNHPYAPVAQRIRASVFGTEGRRFESVRAYQVIPADTCMSAIHFETKLFTIGDWTILKLPKDASAQLPSRGQVMVKGVINGYAFQTPLEPDGNGNHWFRVDKDMQKAAGVAAGDTVAVEVEPTKDWPEPTLPKDWQAALDANPDVLALWKRITPLARWEWLRWIGSSAQPETRKRHIEVSLSKLRAGERRPCCFNRSMCCIPEVSKSGVLLEPANT